MPHVSTGGGAGTGAGRRRAEMARPRDGTDAERHGWARRREIAEEVRRATAEAGGAPPGTGRAPEPFA